MSKYIHKIILYVTPPRLRDTVAARLQCRFTANRLVFSEAGRCLCLVEDVTLAADVVPCGTSFNEL